jgi:hypothetical protein
MAGYVKKHNFDQEKKRGVVDNKTPRNHDDRYNVTSEGIVNSISELSADAHAQLLARTHSDSQRASLLIHLQQTHGNKYVQRLISSKIVQAQLTVSQPDDLYEREADQVAEMVTQGSMSKMQRQPMEEEEELMMKASSIQQQEEEELQMSAIESRDAEVSYELESQINSNIGTGQPLADSVRETLEPQFGHDFSEVNIHNGTEANNLSRQMGAEAFTTGNDIFFKESAYQPDTENGNKLIAHELTHVIQQQAAPLLQRQADTAETTETTQAAATRAGFDAATAASMRHRIMTPIEQAAEEGLAASPPDIRRAVSLISDAIVAVSETRFEAGGFDEDTAASMRNSIMTPLEQAGEALSAALSAPERATELLSTAIVETANLKLEAH